MLVSTSTSGIVISKPLPAGLLVLVPVLVIGNKVWYWSCVQSGGTLCSSTGSVEVVSSNTDSVECIVVSGMLESLSLIRL